MPLSRADIDYIKQAYTAGVERGKGLAALTGALEGALGYSVAHVDKYSPDQTRWATERFQTEKAWRRGAKINAPAMIRRLRFGELQLTGMEFERYFPEGPEDGEATGTGNSFVAAGLTNLFSLWTGLTGAAVNTLHGATGAGSSSAVGVGSSTTAAATSDTALGADNTAGAWYQSFDPSSFALTTPGVAIATATIASANANFTWNEWCWVTGGGAVTAGSHLSTTTGVPFATASSYAMVNHKTGVALGSKSTGSSWVFSTTFTVS